MIRGFIRFIITLAVIAGIAFGGYLYVQHFIYTHSFVGVESEVHGEEYFELDIERGMRASQILDILEEEGLVRNSMIANFIVRLNGWGAVQVGTYRVDASMSLEEMFSWFRGDNVVEIRFDYVTIPEGVRIERIASLLESGLNTITEDRLEELLEDDDNDVNHDDFVMIDAQDLIDLWQDVDFLNELIEEYWFLTDEILNPDLRHPLEGYITPVRHEIPEGVRDLRAITRALLDMTTRRFGYNDIQERVAATDLSIHQWLSFAAIIQGEVSRLDQMPSVAGVFKNRTDIGMHWQTDVTIQYILPEHTERILTEHTQIPSPFNTYLNPGFPIGPVNNPQVSAILAAIEPENHDYLFFFSDMFGCTDGTIGDKIFSRTYAEHDAQARIYLFPAEANGGVCP